MYLPLLAYRVKITRSVYNIFFSAEDQIKICFIERNKKKVFIETIRTIFTEFA